VNGVVHDVSISARHEADAVWAFDLPDQHRLDLVALVEAHGAPSIPLVRIDYDVIDLPLLRLTYYDFDPGTKRLRLSADGYTVATTKPVDVALTQPLPPWWKPKV
jgi:hypothetical protein